MFERFTPKARRVIFFSRYECASYNATALGPEHVLLGLLREDRNLTQKLTGAPLDTESIRAEVAANMQPTTTPASPLDPKLTDATKCALALAAKESEQLGHAHIGTGHLTLGLLAEGNSLAARILNARGVRLEAYREHLRTAPSAE
jgi:ATP-dependent Clp protease ATP-binding subunit ClpC